MLGIVSNGDTNNNNNERTPLLQQQQQQPLLRNGGHSFRSIFQMNSASLSDSENATTPTRNHHAILIRNPSIESVFGGDEMSASGAQPLSDVDQSNDIANHNSLTRSIDSTSSESLSFRSRFERSLRRQYPTMFIIFHSIISISLSAAMIVCERLQPNKFTFDDLEVFSYKTLNGFILWAASTNIMYSLLAIFTGRSS